MSIRDHLALLTLCFGIIFISASLPAHAKKAPVEDRALLDKLHELEEQYQRFSYKFYRKVQSAPESISIKNIEQLQREITRHQDTSPIQAIALIFKHHKLLRNNLDHKIIFQVMQILLENNEWKLASRLYEDLKDEDDKSILATTQFYYAKYYASRKQWKEVHRLLKGQISELSADNADYAYLLNGSALQHLKRHRQAADNYSKIKLDSRFYPYSQLNLAITSLRQGWWSDAKITIKQLLQRLPDDNSDEMVNRLYLVLGYALLQKEYYRDARNAFGKIGLNSRYTSRALLGIGLTASSQGDYNGGLNALNYLKKQSAIDLSVDESYLVRPLIYEKLDQQVSVTSSYTDAMNHYTIRLNELEHLRSRRYSFRLDQFNSLNQALVIEGNALDYNKLYPKSFISNYANLIKIDQSGLAKNVRIRLKKLLNEYGVQYNKIVHQLLDRRISFIQSYLNQSRYGLARLYDKSNEAVN